MQKAIDAVLEAGVASGAVPGVVAIVVDRSGVRYHGAAGERSIGTGATMAPDTVGAIFSMTKAVTGSAAMQLVEQGKIDLDAPMSAVCPEAANPVVLEGFANDGKPITRPAASEPTLRQLLTHTSGYVYDIWNAPMGQWYAATGTPSLFSLQRQALRAPLAFDPGTKWEYGIGGHSRPTSRRQPHGDRPSCRGESGVRNGWRRFAIHDERLRPLHANDFERRRTRWRSCLEARNRTSYVHESNGQTAGIGIKDGRAPVLQRRRDVPRRRKVVGAHVPNT
jgi:Beta-lactamase